MRDNKEELRINPQYIPKQPIPVCLLVEMFKKVGVNGQKTREKALSRLLCREV